MWQLSHPVLKSASLNLVDLGQGNADVTQLWQDDIRLINIIGAVNWQDPAANFQFELCETCGIVGCQPQGWVSVRRLGPDLVGILPAFEPIFDAPKDLENEYLPPVYLHDGSIWLKKSQYEQLGGLVSLPEADQLPWLTSWEAAKLFQWEAPYRVLGELLSLPKLAPDLVLASSEGSFLEQVPILCELVQQLLIGRDRVTLRPVKPKEQIISLYLDIAGIPQWQALVDDGKSYQLYLTPGYVIYQ